MNFYFLRHAQPLVPTGTCYGRTDMPADAELTLAAAAGIAPHLPAGLRIVTSPLQRCVQLTIAIQALRPDLPMRVEANLVEMDFGTWEGRLWADVPRAELAAWTDDFADFRVGGAGESVRQFMGRVGLAYRDVMAPGGAVLWVAHAGVERALRLLSEGVACPTSGRQWPKAGLGFGEWRVMNTAQNTGQNTEQNTDQNAGQNID